MILFIYNTLTAKVEEFIPINPTHVGLYVCGPTLYSNVHIGNLRTFLSFDILYRVLKFNGYNVRYVRNITDVGHLESDEGEDKVSKQARLESVEPMEIVQTYKNDFDTVSTRFNLTPPTIEPTATGHIVEQIGATTSLIEKGLAYVVNGSVYFDLKKYQQTFPTADFALSGRVLEDMISQREVKASSEKRDPADFALWKKADTSHLMQWQSPWGKGFPGWHIECTCMSTKYLGIQFDIHGGGMDLKFPHHEAEIAQATALNNVAPARYWMHTNMLTFDGEKMSKSKGNSILPHQLFSGKHPLLSQSYSPMVVRLYMLQAKYRSTLDITNKGLQSAQKAYAKLMNGLLIADADWYTKEGDPVDNQAIVAAYESAKRSLNDDLNTSDALASLFVLLKFLHMKQMGQLALDEVSDTSLYILREGYRSLLVDVLGLRDEFGSEATEWSNALFVHYLNAKALKQYPTVDFIRRQFANRGVEVRDGKFGSYWVYME